MSQENRDRQDKMEDVSNKIIAQPEAILPNLCGKRFSRDPVKAEACQAESRWPI